MTFGELAGTVSTTLWDMVTALGDFGIFILNVFNSFPAPFNFFFGLFAIYLVAILSYKVASFIAHFIPFLG